jgi:HEAT repeat protein
MRPRPKLVLLALVATLLLFAVSVAASDVSDLMRTLQTGRTPSERSDASYSLSYMGDEAAAALAQALQRSSSSAFRADAAYTLANMREEWLVPVADKLLAATADPHWRVRANIAFALGLLGSISDRVVPSLVDMLDDGDARVRSAAATSLGRLGASDASVIQSLIRSLNDEDRDTRFAAAQSLGKLGPAASGAASALVGLLNDKSLWVREQAADALGSIGVATPEVVQALRTAFFTERDRVTAYEKYLEENPSGWAPNTRACVWAVIGALGKLGAPSAAVLTEIMRDPDYRDEAADRLAKIGEPAVPFLVEAAMDADASIRERAGLTLASVNPAPMSALTDLSKNSRAEVRATAARSLGKLRRYVEGATEVLVKLAADRDSTVRAAAVESLGTVVYSAWPSDDVVQSLTAAALDSSADVRLASAMSMSNLVLFTPELEPAVIALARDSDARVKQVSLGAIGKLIGYRAAERKQVQPEVIGLLVDGLADSDKGVRKAALEGVWTAAVYGLSLDTASVGPRLIRLLDDPELAQKTADTLGLFGPSARPALSALFELYWGANDYDLAWTIAQVGGTEIVPYLSNALMNGGLDVRYKAMEVLIQLGPDAKGAQSALEHVKNNDSDFVLRLMAESLLAALR